MSDPTLIRHSERTLRRACYCHGRTDLYWAHSTAHTTYSKTTASHIAGDEVPYCDKCEVRGELVLIETDGTLHAGKDDGPADAPAVAPPAPTPAAMPPRKPETAVEPPKASATANDTDPRLAALAALLAPQVDTAEIERIVKAELQSVAFPTRTVVIKEYESSKTKKDVEGVSHEKLADVVLDLSIDQPVLMVGPAGTGKSTIARQAAEALSYPYGEISLNPTLTATSLLGYMNATGGYVTTMFREIWEGGGVFHADEFDNGHPSTLATLNAALACAKGNAIAFPDGMITRSDDFRFVASANTYGRGPDRQYVGRQQLDAATLDRFVVEEVMVDEALEHAVCVATGYDTAKVSEVLRYVRQLRHNATEGKLTLIFSPRASIGMCRLLAAGKPLSATIEARVRKGISDADWSKVTRGVSPPSV
jgi:cobaltochelatase CobS